MTASTKRTFFRAENGSTILIGDGEYSTGRIDPNFEYSSLHIVTLDSSGAPVQCTAGIATVTFIDSLGQQETTVNEGDNPIDLTLCGPDFGANRPKYIGTCTSAEITISGLAGAYSVNAYLKRG